MVQNGKKINRMYLSLIQLEQKHRLLQVEHWIKLNLSIFLHQWHFFFPLFQGKGTILIHKNTQQTPINTKNDQNLQPSSQTNQKKTTFTAPVRGGSILLDRNRLVSCKL